MKLENPIFSDMTLVATVVSDGTAQTSVRVPPGMAQYLTLGALDVVIIGQGPVTDAELGAATRRRAMHHAEAQTGQAAWRPNSTISQPLAREKSGA
jgi:hypothetical protein